MSLLPTREDVARQAGFEEAREMYEIQTAALNAKIKGLLEERKGLRCALKPFAAAAESMADMPFPDGDRWLWKPSRSHGPDPAGISAAHLRTAQEALQKGNSDGD